jgi:hypothetical protein
MKSLFFVLLLVALSASGQPIPVSITGPVLRADGVGYTGTAIITPLATKCGGVKVVPMDTVVAISKGVLSPLKLFSSDDCGGAGYSVRYSPAVSGRTMYWEVPSSGPVTVGQIERAILPLPIQDVPIGAIRVTAEYVGKCIGSLDGLKATPVPCGGTTRMTWAGTHTTWASTHTRWGAN